VGFEGIINLCPLRALCQKAFPASLNFSPEVCRKSKELMKLIHPGLQGKKERALGLPLYAPFRWQCIGGLKCPEQKVLLRI